MVSAGFGVNELCDQYKRQHDDYNEIMTKAIADRFKVYQIPLIIATLLISAGLIWGGVGSLQLNPKGPTILVPSLWLAVPVDIVRGALGIYIGQATTGVMRNYMQQMFQAASAGNADA